MPAWSEWQSSDGARAGAPLVALLAFALAVAPAAAGSAETRVALVIGNARYAAFQPLANPVNDAEDVAAALEGLGFEVMRGADLGRTAMAELLGRFVRAARDADVALFYYAGHGFQVDGQNYLLPTDAAIRTRGDLGAATLRLDDISRELAGGSGIRLVFLDACRNNPLPPGIAPDPSQLRSGLAQIGDAAGFLFAFATQPDAVAYDGIGRNSIFTRALLGHLGTPTQDIATMMIEVRNDVIAATGGKQVPWENSSLTRRFAFEPDGEPVAPDTLLWQIAATEQDADLLRHYLDRYPEGPHVTDARGMLDGMTTAALSAEGPGGTRDLDPSRDPALADALWEVARGSRHRVAVEAYLERAPDGHPHAEEARRMLAFLSRPDGPELSCERLATHPHDATAAIAGVPLVEVTRNARAAIGACRAAAGARPDLPHFTALLARATYAAGDRSGAARLLRDAADRGDVRAMYSLARMLERGDGVPRDIPAAMALYEAAAAGGSTDAANDLAFVLLAGRIAEPDPPRALELLRGAAEAGSGDAMLNLGTLAIRRGDAEQGLDYYRQAAALGERRVFVPAATILDRGQGVPRDSEAAAGLLLRGVASDYGEALGQLTGNAGQWHRETILAVQRRLQVAGFYQGALDGISGPMMTTALEDWRRGGHLVGR